jgi:hypothetical protein
VASRKPLLDTVAHGVNPNRAGQFNFNDIVATQGNDCPDQTPASDNAISKGERGEQPGMSGHAPQLWPHKQDISSEHDPQHSAQLDDNFCIRQYRLSRSEF